METLNRHELLSLIKQTEAPYCYYLYANYLDGAIKHIHYGYFESGDETLCEAQVNLACVFKALIPSDVKRLLDSGCGIGSTTWELTTDGYDVTGISPQHNSLEIARKTYPTIAGRFITSSYQAFSAPQKFDALFFQESSQYIPTVKLFGGACRLLRRGGHIIICDEVRYVSDASMPFNFRDEMLQFAASCGFQLTYNRVITDKVLPTRRKLVSIFQDRFTEFREQFRKIRPNFEQELKDLASGWESETEKFECGLYGYEIFHFIYSGTNLSLAPRRLFLSAFHYYRRMRAKVRMKRDA